MVQISAQGRERFAQGFWIILYPEGTRIPVGKRVRYKTGAARLAIEMQVPILPIAHNAGWLWPKGVHGQASGHRSRCRSASRSRRMEWTRRN